MPSTAAAPARAACTAKPPLIAIEVEDPRASRANAGDKARGCRAGRRTSRSSARRAGRQGTSRRSRGPPPARRASPSPPAPRQRQPFERARRAVVAQHDRLGRQQRGERIEDERLEPSHAGGIRLHDEHRPEAVDDQARQPVGLGMDEAIIGRLEEPLAQPERALEPAREKAPADRPAGVAIQEARREQAVRVEHRHPERRCSSARRKVTSVPGAQRLRRRVHPHLVRIDPRVAAFGAPVPPGSKRDEARVAGSSAGSRPRQRVSKFIPLSCPRRRLPASPIFDAVAIRDPPCLSLPRWSSCCRPGPARSRHAPVAQLDRAPDYGSGG